MFAFCQKTEVINTQGHWWKGGILTPGIVMFHLLNLHLIVCYSSQLSFLWLCGYVWISVFLSLHKDICIFKSCFIRTKTLIPRVHTVFSPSLVADDSQGDYKHCGDLYVWEPLSETLLSEVLWLAVTRHYCEMFFLWCRMFNETLLSRCMLADTMRNLHTNPGFYSFGVNLAQEIVVYSLCLSYSIHAEEGINM